jgi:RNA polymerase sigma-70 factor (ECF subfamily)
VRIRDAGSWRRLSQLFGPEIYRWARTAGLQPSDASDVVQEVFRAVAAKVGDFQRRGPGDSFRGWLWTITRNKIRDHFRQQSAQVRGTGGTDAWRELESIPEESDASGSRSAIAPSRGGLSRRALELIRGEFEESTWQAFWKVVVDGVPAAEAAADLGTTPGAVRQAKYRVLRRLRQEMEGLLE